MLNMNFIAVKLENALFHTEIIKNSYIGKKTPSIKFPSNIYCIHTNLIKDAFSRQILQFFKVYNFCPEATWEE